MPWAAIIPAVAAVGGAAISSSANNRATDAQVASNERGIEEQRRQFDITQKNFAPFLETGQQANQTLKDILLNGASFNATDLPGYEQYKQAGLDAVERSGYARGQGLSGRTLASLYNQGQAFDYGVSNDYLNRISNLSGGGQTSASNLGAFGQNNVNSISNLLNNQGNARASGIQNNSQNFNNLLQNLGTNAVANEAGIRSSLGI